MNVVVAADISTLMRCSRASLLASPIEVPASTVPMRWMAPVCARIASSNVVLPLWNGPTSAMHRGPAFDLGMSASTPGPSLREALPPYAFKAGGHWQARRMGGEDGRRPTAPDPRDATVARNRSDRRPPSDDCRRSAQIAAEALDAAARLFELRGRRRIRDAERRAQAERRALDDGDAFGFEQFGDEVLVGLDLLAGWRGLADSPGAERVDVERAIRLGAVEPFCLVEHADREITPRLEHRVVLGDEILGPVERLDRRPLGNRVRIGGRLGLQGRHRFDQELRRARVTDAPAGHAEGLGNAVERQRALVQRGRDLRRSHRSEE